MPAIEPPSLLTLTIRGRELERSIGSRTWITRQGPNRLTSIASATVPRSALLAVAHRSYMVEALLISTSVRPNRSFTHSAIEATLTELSTSSWQARIRTPSGSSSLAAISPLRRSREPSTTPKPSRASWRHTSRPTPRLPPVTTATGMSKDTYTTSACWDREVYHLSCGCRLGLQTGKGKSRLTSPEMSVQYRTLALSAIVKRAYVRPSTQACRGCAGRRRGFVRPANREPTARLEVAAGILVL